MVLLDPAQAYTLQGSAAHDELVEKEDKDQPKILHLRLSASVLEAIIASQDGPNSVRLTLPNGRDPLLLINEERHPLHYSAESNPHQLYSCQAGSSNLQRVGDVTSKLSIGPESQSSSSATTRLKERRELEEAKKTEHRTVLLDTAPPSTRNRPVSSSTSRLKLRAKGLAPASTSSPLIRSRANTPIDLHSRPGSPSLGATGIARTPPTTSPALLNLQGTSIKASPLSRSVKVVSSPPSLKRNLIQLLATGPTSRRDLAQQLQQNDAAILSILEQVGQAAPKHLQPTALTTKRANIPANRRSLAPGQAPIASQNGDAASMLYILKDEVYRQIMIKEWSEYSTNDKLIVSEHMEAAFKRLGLDKDAEEWKRLYPDGRTGKTLSKDAEPGSVEAAAGDALSMKRETSGASSADSQSKDEAGDNAVAKKQTNKKKSNQDRLRSMKKGAKARNNSRTDTPTPTASKASLAKSTKAEEKVEIEEVPKLSLDESPLPKPKVKAAAPSRSPAKKLEVTLPSKPAKIEKPTTIQVTAPQKTAAHVKSASRKKIEYTDSSSSEDEMQLDDLPLAPKKAEAAKTTAHHSVKTSSSKAAPSSSLEGKRSRQGVGSGAAFSSEPWLDVRNSSDWKRLAERFKRVHEEFLSGRSRLREEENLIRADLELARADSIKSDSSLHIEDEREEGEASPVGGPTKGILRLDFDPHNFTNVAWRSDKTLPKPMSYEELETSVLKLKEMEAQLNRMKGALQTSKKALEMGHAT